MLTRTACIYCDGVLVGGKQNIWNIMHMTEFQLLCRRGNARCPAHSVHAHSYSAHSAHMHSYSAQRTVRMRIPTLYYTQCE